MKQGFLLKHLDMTEYNMEKVLIDKVVECNPSPMQFSAPATASRTSMKTRSASDAPINYGYMLFIKAYHFRGSSPYEYIRFISSLYTSRASKRISFIVFVRMPRARKPFDSRKMFLPISNPCSPSRLATEFISVSTSLRISRFWHS